MKKTILSVCAIGTLLMTSCSTTNYTYRLAKINKDNVITNSAVVDADVDLKNKITVTSSKRNTALEAQEEAYYKAITENNVDFIIDPIFEINTTDKILFWGGKTIAKLTGWGGKYSNSRLKTEAIKELKSIDPQSIQKFNSIYNNSEKNYNSSIKKTNIFGL